MAPSDLVAWWSCGGGEGGEQQVKDIAAPLLHRQDHREPPFALLQVNRKLPKACLLPPHAQAIVLQLERDAQGLSEATGSFVLVVGFGDDGAYLTGGPRLVRRSSASPFPSIHSG